MWSDQLEGGNRQRKIIGRDDDDDDDGDSQLLRQNKLIVMVGEKSISREREEPTDGTDHP